MIRLFVQADLASGAVVALGADQAHYVTRVMRQAVGDEISLFNGRDGEWRTEVTRVGKRDCHLRVDAQTRPQTKGLDLDLIIALVKRVRLETIVEKAAELGVRRVQIITTERTNADHTNLVRLAAIAVEASEQTGRLETPEILAPRRLADLLGDWPATRRLMFCDEGGDAQPAGKTLEQAAMGPWAVLIGPEGGFSPAERVAVRALKATLPVSLGPRILRADTAAIAALTLWQSHLGDWRGA
jgi:16S rRNA (uracil1498-N3)-methyltransferase